MGGSSRERNVTYCYQARSIFQTGLKNGHPSSCAMMIGGLGRQVEGESGMDKTRASSADSTGQTMSHETQPQKKLVSSEARLA